MTEDIRIDNERLKFIEEHLQTISPCYSFTHSKTEDGGVDIYGKPADDFFAGIIDAFEMPKTPHIEAKTFKGRYEGWKRKNDDYFFGCTPSPDMDINEVRNNFEFPKEEEIRLYYNDNPYPEYASSTWTKEDMQLKSNQRLYMLNAATTTKSGEYVFVDSEEGKYLPKWYKLYNDENSELCILFKDGILYYDHQALLDSFRGYCYHFNFPEEEINKNNKEKIWEFKALIDLDKGKLFKAFVPDELL